MRTFTKSMLLFMAVICNLQLIAQTEYTPVVSADKMNVLYIGIANPVSVAIPGISSDNLRVSIQNGSITGDRGKYIVRVENTQDVIIIVSAEIKPGEIKEMGKTTFRVKRIPDPLVGLNGKYMDNLTVSKAELLKHAELNVLMMLPFELKFEIESFTLTYTTDKSLVRETTGGNVFTQKMLDDIAKLAKGSKVFIEDIKAKGPDGATRVLQSLTLVLYD